MKIVINSCFGGFSLSKKAYEFLGLEWDDYGYAHIYNRTDPDLIRCIETLGSERASGLCAELHVIEIPDDIEYEIHNYDGIESVHEKHRSWEYEGESWKD